MLAIRLLGAALATALATLALARLWRWADAQNDARIAADLVRAGWVPGPTSAQACLAAGMLAGWAALAAAGCTVEVGPPTIVLTGGAGGGIPTSNAAGTGGAPNRDAASATSASASSGGAPQCAPDAPCPAGAPPGFACCVGGRAGTCAFPAITNPDTCCLPDAGMPEVNCP